MSKIEIFTRTDDLLGTREVTIQEDDPGLDGTGFEHPAWHRGVKRGADLVCAKIEAIMDGKDTGKGILHDVRLEALRRRLLKFLEHVDGDYE